MESTTATKIPATKIDHHKSAEKGSLKDKDRLIRGFWYRMDIPVSMNGTVKSTASSLKVVIVTSPMAKSASSFMTSPIIPVQRWVFGLKVPIFMSFLMRIV
nr:ionotropic receptor [Semanotus bifasciatus]